MSKSSSPKTSSKPLSPSEVTGYFNALDTLTGGSHVAPTSTQVWVPDTTTASGGSTDIASVINGSGSGKSGNDSPFGIGASGHYETVTTPGSDSAGRLSSYALNGTPAVPYVGAGKNGIAQAATMGDQTGNIRALGGLGATQTAEVNRARREALQQIQSDAGLDVAQKARSRQLSDNDYAARLAAIAKETESAIGQAALSTAATNAGFQQQVNLANPQAARAEAVQKYSADVRNADQQMKDAQAIASIFFGGQGQTQSGGGTSSSIDAAKIAEAALAAAAFFSSAALKEDIGSLPADGAVLALEPVSYRWRPGTEALRAGHDGDVDVGLIAEQVAEVIPALTVRDEAGRVIGVRYHLLPVLLLAEVKRLNAEVAAMRLQLDNKV